MDFLTVDEDDSALVTSETYRKKISLPTHEKVISFGIVESE